MNIPCLPRRGRTPRALAAGLVLGLVATLSACAGAPKTLQADPIRVELPRPISDFDLVVTASAQGNTLFADLYGITLHPLSAHRITTDKRISSVDATQTRIVVAAADGRTDRLGYVTPNGDIEPIPGLGRPFAYTPSLLPDGTILFRDFSEKGGDRLYRTRVWDPRTQGTKTILRSPKPLVALTPGPKDQFALLDNTGENSSDSVVIVGGKGNRREIPLGIDGGYMRWGRNYIAIALPTLDAHFGDRSLGTMLLDPHTGKTTTVKGWHPIAWTADGKKLLVRKTTEAVTSELGFLDPANPNEIESLGTIPDLTIYDGAWVRGVS